MSISTIRACPNYKHQELETDCTRSLRTSTLYRHSPLASMLGCHLKGETKQTKACLAGCTKIASWHATSFLRLARCKHNMSPTKASVVL